MENKRKEVPMDALENVNGGVIVKEGEGRYWVVRQDGTVYAPAPSLEKAIEFAQTIRVSTELLTRDDYRKRFGRDLMW